MSDLSPADRRAIVSSIVKALRDCIPDDDTRIEVLRKIEENLRRAANLAEGLAEGVPLRHLSADLEEKVH